MVKAGLLQARVRVLYVTQSAVFYVIHGRVRTMTSSLFGRQKYNYKCITRVPNRHRYRTRGNLDVTRDIQRRDSARIGWEIESRLLLESTYLKGNGEPEALCVLV